MRGDGFAFIYEGGIYLSKKHNDYGTNIPRHEVEALAHCLLPDIRRYYESEQGKREFAEWKAKQAEEKGDHNEKSS